jgi:hypothetical protein
MTAQQLFEVANKQAQQLPKLHNQRVRSRQIVMLCETLKQALKAS